MTPFENLNIGRRKAKLTDRNFKIRRTTTLIYLFTTTMYNMVSKSVVLRALFKFLSKILQCHAYHVKLYFDGRDLKQTTFTLPFHSSANPQLIEPKSSHPPLHPHASSSNSRRLLSTHRITIYNRIDIGISKSRKIWDSPTVELQNILISKTKRVVLYMLASKRI